ACPAITPSTPDPGLMTPRPSDDARIGEQSGHSRPRASLRSRFALAIVGVSAAVVASFGAVVHRQMTESATSAASEHLQRAAREVAGMFGANAKNMREAIAAVAADTEIVQFLGAPTQRRAESAREALKRLSMTPGHPDVELWDATGSRTRASYSSWPELPDTARAAR